MFCELKTLIFRLNYVEQEAHFSPSLSFILLERRGFEPQAVICLANNSLDFTSDTINGGQSPEQFGLT